MNLPSVNKEEGIFSMQESVEDLAKNFPGYDIYELDYTDETTTTEYYRTIVSHEHKMVVATIYDIDYCDYIDQPDLSNLADGKYKYIAYGDYEMRIAPITGWGNGAKHIQLSTSVGNSEVYMGGGILKNGNNYILDFSSGYCSVAGYIEEDQDAYQTRLRDAMTDVLNKYNLPATATVEYTTDRKAWSIHDNIREILATITES